MVLISSVSSTIWSLCLDPREPRWEVPRGTNGIFHDEKLKNLLPILSSIYRRLSKASSTTTVHSLAPSLPLGHSSPFDSHKKIEITTYHSRSQANSRINWQLLYLKRSPWQVLPRVSTLPIRNGKLRTSLSPTKSQNGYIRKKRMVGSRPTTPFERTLKFSLRHSKPQRSVVQSSSGKLIRSRMCGTFIIHLLKSTIQRKTISWVPFSPNDSNTPTRYVISSFLCPILV